jgi:hypothetical protein
VGRTLAAPAFSLMPCFSSISAALAFAATYGRATRESHRGLRIKLSEPSAIQIGRTLAAPAFSLMPCFSSISAALAFAASAAAAARAFALASMVAALGLEGEFEGALALAKQPSSLLDPACCSRGLMARLLMLPAQRGGAAGCVWRLCET